ncbi:MAG: glycosyltransferase [Steroidobacteraceae bacterium]|jgi:UDP:flavonoid glycosyltransferase YjiC (YdhE family)|nr:glycosyltransferase [Steroidobacteraceae bacterium]
MRFLFTTFEGGGHVPPMLVVARELRRRGHLVRVVSDEANRAAVQAAGLDFDPWRRAPNRREAARPDDPLDDWRNRWPARVVRAICDAVICGPAAAYAADTLAMLDEFEPDLLVSNELLFGVMAAAEATAMPLALLTANVWCFPTRTDLPPFGPGFAPARHAWQSRRDHATRRMIAAMYDAGLDDLNLARRRLGLPPLAATLAQLQAARLVVLGTSGAFDFGDGPPPAPFRYAGPLFEADTVATPAEARLVDPHRPNVLVAFSTAYQGQAPLVRRCIEALAPLSVHGIVTRGPALEATPLPAAANVEVVARAPHGALLPHCAAVICQGGHGTVLRALLHGVPVLCIPTGRDNFDNARRLVQRDAGLRLRRGCSVRAIRRALDRLLHEPRWRTGAATLGAAVRSEADHGRRAADLLERAVVGAP